jgi:hypothetical protein
LVSLARSRPMTCSWTSSPIIAVSISARLETGSLGLVI